MIGEFSITSASNEETKKLGHKIGLLSFPGAFIALYGELGAGKTCFAGGVADGLGAAETVSSPSFVIISEYEGRIPLYHIDLYRLSDPAEVEALGYEEYFYGDGVVVVEWAERAADLLPEERIDVELKFSGRDERVIDFRFIGDGYREFFESFKEAVREGLR
jgi:tRNA threonylcarbamoyladenosine biosynthesis protein TsaE